MVMRQLELFEFQPETPATSTKGTPVELFPLDEYDHILISSSSGKDSTVCLLMLIELGADLSKIELIHQSVDGGITDSDYVEFMDWPITESYLQAIADHFGIPARFQWRENGIRGEMLRKDSLTGDVYYLDDDGQIAHLPTTKGNKSTRLKFPAMAASLTTRWCSATAKIDVFRRVVNNHPRYRGTIENPKKILVVTGERREESAQRAKYLETELHSTNTLSRIVHWWRPVIDYTERDIWDKYERWHILPHPAYLLGWGRTSCFSCIFQNADLWRMMQEIAPERFNRIAQMEQELNHTIDPRMTVIEKAKRGSLDRLPTDARVSKWVQLALSRTFRKQDLIMNKWELPAGAFKGAAGGAI